MMKDRASIEELEARLRSLPPRAELVARMAVRLRCHDIWDKKSYFTRIAALTKELGLTTGALNVVLADAQKVAANLNTGDLASSDLANDLDPRTAVHVANTASESPKCR